MRDLLILGFITFLICAAMARPFLMSMAYIYVDLVSPQRITFYLLNAVPFSLIMAVLAVTFFLFFDDKRNVRFGRLQTLMLIWVVWVTITTLMAQVPEFAWIKWSNAWKSIAFGIFLPLVLHTRQRIEVALFFVVLCVGVITITGGVKTLVGGGGYGSLNLLVDANSGLYEGSTIAAVSIALIPIILYLFRHNTLFPRSRLLQLATGGLVLSALLIPIGTEARTGLVCIAVLGFMMFLKARRKILMATVLAVIAVSSVPFLPDSFTGRMSTIKTYDEDESASTRVAVWGWTWDFVKSHPLGGGFDAYRLNKVVYDISASSGAKRIEDKARAYHSSYFEALGEHGYPGALIYIGIQLTAIWQLARISRRFKSAEPDSMWLPDLARAITHTIVILMVGGLFVGIAFQTILYIVVALAASLIQLVAVADETKRQEQRTTSRLPRGMQLARR